MRKENKKNKSDKKEEVKKRRNNDEVRKEITGKKLEKGEKIKKMH